jgi:hypothetical protein
MIIYRYVYSPLPLCRHLGFRYFFFQYCIYAHIFIIFAHIFGFGCPKVYPTGYTATDRNDPLSHFSVDRAVGVFLVIFCILLLTRSRRNHDIEQVQNDNESQYAGFFFFTF